MSVVTMLTAFFNQAEKITPKEKYSFKNVREFVEDYTNNFIKNNIDEKGLDIDEYEKQLERKKELKSISKRCGQGDFAAKAYFKSFISDLITQKYGVSEENIDYTIDFNNVSNVVDMFDIILYSYKKEFGYDAVRKIILKYELNRLKDFNGERMFAVTEEDIINIFRKESPKLSFSDKLEIVTQRIYQCYKGLGVIDELRDMNINGVSLGVSGVPVDFLSKFLELEIKNKKVIKYRKSYESVWLYFDGNEICLDFLGFESQQEFERVCKLVYKFNNIKQFSRSDGYIFNTMADLSRVAVFRPPFAESWAAFIRKFDKDGDLDELVVGKGAAMVKKLLTYIVQGEQKIAIIGPQGVGKTTMLIALIKKIYPMITIRVWEDFFEAYIRIKLPWRNVLTTKAIPSIDGEEGLDALKKSNGQVTIVSEAAEDKVINFIVKVSLTASRFIIYSHHANDDDELFEALRNGTMNTGAFRDENIAEKQILRALDCTVSLAGELDTGERYIGKVSEFIRLDEKPFPELQLDEEMEYADFQKIFYKAFKTYFERRTGAKKYKVVNLVKYDKDNKEFIVTNKLSEERRENILRKLLPEDRQEFLKFIKEMDDAYEKQKLRKGA